MTDGQAYDATAAVSTPKLAVAGPANNAPHMSDDIEAFVASTPTGGKATDGNIRSSSDKSSPAADSQTSGTSPQYNASAATSSSRGTGSRGAAVNGHSPSADSADAREPPDGDSPSSIVSRLFDSGRHGSTHGTAGGGSNRGGTYGSPPLNRSTPSGAHLTAATPGQPRPQAMSPGQGESPHAEGSLPAVIREALRRRSNRRTLFEHSVHKEFGNGDKYHGGWQAGLPQGDGVYTWADGSVYDGNWQAGVKQGEGKYTWPSGAVFRGDWHDGCMHGHGTLQGPDGSIYTGGWQKDQKHGLGRKAYATGDVYEGLWKSGKPEGPGRYRWANGNEYDGEWRLGRMHGQGTLKWASDDRYDGKWEEGEQSGVGVFTWADGSSYNGFWRNGRKHGVGVYKPSGEPRQQSSLGERQMSLAARLVPSAQGGRASMDANDRTAAAAAAAVSSADGDRPDAAAGQGRSGTGTSERDTGRSATAVVREYEDGALVREEPIPGEQLEVVLGKRAAPVKRRQRRARAKGPKRPGERIYKGHKSYDLMLNLQLGIRYSVGGVHARPSAPMLLPSDFEFAAQQYFPRDGSRATPPHPASNFKWKDYCPAAFSKLRRTFHIDPADYMLSICGDKALRELPSPGKSGSVFFISHDERFFIKTMRKGEMELLLKLLPRYSAHIAQYPDTLLIKYLGLHRIKPANGGKVRFVVMNNLLRTDVPLHRKFDLKGSTYGRSAGPDAPPTSVHKDLDVDITLQLPGSWYQRFEAQLRADCALLEALRVMDYSLLLGIHSRSGGGLSSTPQHTDAEQEDTEVEEPDSPLGPRSPSSRWPSMVAAARWPSGLLGRASAAAGGIGIGGGGTSRQASQELPPGAAAAAAGGGLPNGGLSEEEPYSSGGEAEAGPRGEGSGQGEPSGRSFAGAGGAAARLHMKPANPGGGSAADRDLQRTQQIILRRFGDKARTAHGNTFRGMASLRKVSEQRVEDLLQLALYKKMGRAQKEARPPASFGSELPRTSDAEAAPAAGAAAQDGDASGGSPRREGSAAAAVAAGQQHRLPLGVRNPGVAVPDGGGAAEEVLLYFGIIDILQEYNVSKRVEHRFKSLVHDGRTISAVSPVTYSRRFQAFLLNIFRPKPVKAAAAVLALAADVKKRGQEKQGPSQQQAHEARPAANGEVEMGSAAPRDGAQD